MQYQTGTVSVTNGSQTVTGLGTVWLGAISIGDVFKIAGVNITVTVGAIVSDTEITLSANWSGTTMYDQTYTITRDFEPSMGYREVWQGDKDWPFHLTETIRAIGSDMLGGSSSYAVSTVLIDATWTDVIPAGYMLCQVIIQETAGNAAILSMGTADGLTDVFEDIPIAASDITVITIDDMYSKLAAQTLDLNADGPGGDWNSASVNVTLLMRRVS